MPHQYRTIKRKKSIKRKKRKRRRTLKMHGGQAKDPDMAEKAGEMGEKTAVIVHGVAKNGTKRHFKPTKVPKNRTPIATDNSISLVERRNFTGASPSIK